MTKIRAKLETSFTKTSEHKNFIKHHNVKNISTSKTKDGRKFIHFILKDSVDFIKMKEGCSKLNYELTIE